MPAPPIEIRIKRKATDDPVELLHVQNEYNGLRQIKQYVFKRQRTSTAPNNNILKPVNPRFLSAQQHHISSPKNATVTRAPQLTETRAEYSQGLEQTPDSSERKVPDASAKTSTAEVNENEVEQLPSATSRTEPRRFHLSRGSVHNSSGVALLPNTRDAKGSPSIFIERRRALKLNSKVSNVSIPHTISLTSQNASNGQHMNGDSNAQLPQTDDQSRPPAPLRNVKLSSGDVVPWDADSATLAAQMQAYTMQEIGHNLARASSAETSITTTPIIRARQVSSFKPKAPALRNHDRHPEHAKFTERKDEVGQDEVMTDATDPGGDESGYVMDTYIRMPAEMFEYEEQKSVGLIVLDSQPDIDEFYNEDSDSDSEIYDEEEDENAENHPSTDYPEDEVESDDEYGLHPYQRYRNRNASDKEEFDEDDVINNDDESNSIWARRPWMANNAYHRKGEQDDDDD